VTLYNTRGAFAALKRDGSVVTWGNQNNGGDSSGVSDQLKSGVLQIFSTTTAFAALKEGGKVVVWGNRACGGFLDRETQEQLSSGVTAIYPSASAFAASRADGRVITWGQAGQPSVLAEVMANGGIAVKTNGRAFAMVLASGEMVFDTHDTRMGSFFDKVASQLASGVVALDSTQGAFAALKDDGSVVAWGQGNPVNLGGDSAAVASQLERGVIAIRSTQSAFAALKDISK